MTKAIIKQGKAKITLKIETLQDAFNLTQREFYNKWGDWTDDKAFTTTGNLMRSINQIK